MTSQDVLSAGGRAGRNPPREMTSSPGQFPAIRTSSPGTSRGWRTAGGAIGPATIPDDGSSQSTISRWVSQGAELLCTCIIVPNLAPMPAAGPLTPVASRSACCGRGGSGWRRLCCFSSERGFASACQSTDSRWRSGRLSWRAGQRKRDMEVLNGGGDGWTMNECSCSMSSKSQFSTTHRSMTRECDRGTPRRNCERGRRLSGRTSSLC